MAMAGLLAPGVLALLGFTPLPLALLEQAGLAGFAALIGYLAAADRRRGLAAGGVVRAGAGGSGAGGRARRPWCAPALRPARRCWWWRRSQAAGRAAAVAAAPCRCGRSMPCSVLAALVQAVLVAAAAQDRQRAADTAAAEGAAMYRFLADNAMDLITRHSADGRIRFASPAACALLGRAPEELVGLALPGAGASRRSGRGAGGADGIQLFRPRRRGRSAAAPSRTAIMSGRKSAAARRRRARASPPTSWR